MTALGAGPDWTGIMTAIGTVALAIVAVFAPIYTEWRANKRLKAEHERSDKLLADERDRSVAALRDERQLGQDREQLAEAYSVQVVLMKFAVRMGEDAASKLVVNIVNHGSYTITQIEAQFSPDGKNVVSHHKTERLAGIASLPDEMRPSPPFLGSAPSAEAASYSDRLAPWDTGMIIQTDEMATKRLTDPHRRGEVRKIEQSAAWSLR